MSDVDILVDFSGPPTFRGFMGLKLYLEDALGVRVDLATARRPSRAQLEVFMKLAGPYWMSCVTKNEAIPILEPDHYETYLDGYA